MQDRSDRIEPHLESLAAEVAELATRVSGLAARVAALESHLGPRAADVPRRDRRDDLPTADRPRAAPPSAPVAGAGTIDWVGLLAPAGRACLVLGGAYFLRALTESGRLPLATGVALGFLYALAWIVMADRAARRGAVGATFHGLAGVSIALPILWEATTRFALVPATWSAVAAALFVATTLAVARHRRLQALAGAAILGATGLGLGLGLAATGGALLPFAFFLVGVWAAAWWLGGACAWNWLKGPPAAASMAAVAGLWMRAGLVPPPDAPPLALAAALLVAATPCVFTTRRVRRDEPVRLSDAVATCLALLCGIGAATAVASHLGPGAVTTLGASLLVIGAGSYGSGFGLLRSRPAATSGFLYLVSLGLVLFIVATATLLTGMGRDLAFTVLAVASAWPAARLVHPVFAVHSAVFTLAAAVSSGLVACAASCWLGMPVAWPAFPPTGGAVLIAALAGGVIPRRLPARALELAASASRLLLALVLVATVGSLVLLIVGPPVAGVPPDPGRLASLRTVVLSVAAVALALVARLPFGGELGWLAWPVLIAGGVKFLVEDFRVSAASTLFVSFAVYGLALILTARVRRGRAST